MIAVVLGALIDAITRSAETGSLLERLQDEGEQALRGRSEPVRIWTRRRLS